ncbi:MAG: CRTAC1 family protein [Acidobacteria bacterium]|nr:CRTAC1 family protein [Acidobacteriota bacterium]
MAGRLLPVLALAGCPAWAQGMGSSVRVTARPPAVKAGTPAPAIDYRDVAAAWGLAAPNVYGGEAKKRYILEMTGNGVAVGDFDQDGWPDLFFVNGTRLDLAAGPVSRLYRNQSGAGFIDVTAKSGITRTGWGQGVCAGDYDNDGRIDLFVTYYGEAGSLYRNSGGGTFRDVSREAGFAPGPVRWETGCAFLDFDRDGALDLFVSHYVAFDLGKAAAPGASPFCFWKGVAVFCGPRGFGTGVNALYRNVGGGRFADVSKKAGIVLAGLHYGLGVAVSDFDADGWPDIYVACDSTPGILYANQRDGTFADIAVPAGAAYGEAGQEQGSMGAAAGDYDNDGRIDIVKTNFMDETPTLYHNDGERFFTDTTFAAGLGIHTKYVGWGVSFLDADQDGRKDLLMAHGHIYPEIEGSKSGERFRQEKLLYWNAGKVFVDVTGRGGAALREPWSSRGLATGDLDGDGTVEAVVVNMNAPPSVLKNHAPAGNAMVLDLGAIGTRVSVEAGGVTQVDEVRSGGSYASHSDLALHFGLGSAQSADRVRITWPDGTTESLTDVPANHRISVRKGAGVTARRAFRR